MNQQLSNQEEELTVEEYKVRVMQQRFAERITEYEDIIATLITQNAQLEQELRQYKESSNEEPVQEE